MSEQSKELSLLEAQQLFTSLLGKLITWAYQQGYSLTIGDGYRADRLGHMASSLHYIRLAQDLNLFVGDKWKKDECPEWYKMGAYWLSLDPLCAWGGRFKNMDLNHFSLKYGGRQ